MNNNLATFLGLYSDSFPKNDSLIKAYSFFINALSSAAVLQALILRIKSLNLVDIFFF